MYLLTMSTLWWINVCPVWYFIFSLTSAFPFFLFRNFLNFFLFIVLISIFIYFALFACLIFGIILTKTALFTVPCFKFFHLFFLWYVCKFWVIKCIFFTSITSCNTIWFNFISKSTKVAFPISWTIYIFSILLIRLIFWRNTFILVFIFNRTIFFFLILNKEFFFIFLVSFRIILYILMAMTALIFIIYW